MKGVGAAVHSVNGSRPARGLRSTGALNTLLLRYFKEALDGGRRGQPVAWVSPGFPVEILHGMGIVVVCPLTSSIINGLMQRDTRALSAAEAAGYATDLCSEIKCQLGEMLTDDYGFVELPRPTVVLSSTNYCTSFVKWAQAVERHFGVPGYYLDLPIPRPRSHVGAERYYLDQFAGLQRFLEEQTGGRCDPLRTCESFMRAEETNTTWLRIMALNRHRPAPLNALDSYVHLLPLSVLRGTEEALGYYRRLEREVRTRIDDGVAALPAERHRLLWDYLPVYARMRFFTRKFAHYGATFVVAPYFLTSESRVAFRNLQRAVYSRLLSLGWGSAILLSYSLRYAARAYLAQDASQPLDQRVARLARLVREYSVDGFVLHNYRSCRRFCATQYELKEALTAATGVPGVVFDADAFDSRYFSEGQVNTRIEAFMEALEQKGVDHGPATR